MSPSMDIASIMLLKLDIGTKVRILKSIDLNFNKEMSQLIREKNNITQVKISRQHRPNLFMDPICSR